MNEHEFMQADGRPVAQPSTRTRAVATIAVRSFAAEPYDETASPALKEIRLRETFTGSIEGESTAARALQVQHDDGSATQVSMARFRGSLDGRRGTFVLQGSAKIERGEIDATWFVVPGSATGELSGLRGEGGFQGRFGEGSVGTLEYWFESEGG